MFENLEAKRKVRRFRARCLVCNAELVLIDDRNIDPWEWVKSDQISSFLPRHRENCGAGNEKVAGIEVDEIAIDEIELDTA